MKVLLVEDDAEVGGMLAEAMSHRGHVVDHAQNGQDALWLAGEQSYEAVLLDVGLPDISGTEVCATLRREHPALPVLMLTGRNEVRDRVRGLDAGADDYLAKPVSLAELDARLRALGRRAQRPVVEVYVAGDVVVSPSSREVRRQGRLVALVGREYSLVELLARRAGDVVSRQHLTAHLWTNDVDVTDNALDVLVAAVRRKLDGPFREAAVTTVRGQGYRLG